MLILAISVLIIDDDNKKMLKVSYIYDQIKV